MGQDGVFTIHEIHDHMLTVRQKAVLSHLFDAHKYDLLLKILSMSYGSPHPKDRPYTAADGVLAHILLSVFSHVSSMKERHENWGVSPGEQSSSGECFLKVWIETGTWGIPEAVANEYLSDKYADKEFVDFLDQRGIK
ncbi:MAG: hypothetical protein JWP89_748 [Schlesneria sp.]|nr:hypothetical protein [Schlesneria sp.]